MSAPKTDLPPLTTGDTMHEVEPGPVDENDNMDFDPEKPRGPSSSSTNFLGLTPSTTQYILSSLQRYSTLPPTLYFAMHYTNTALIPLATRNVAEADKYLLLTRPYYQTFPLEGLVIFAPILTHVVSGIALRIYRRRLAARRHGAETHAQRKEMPWPKVSAISALGFALYPMFVAHVLTMRIIPKKVEGNSAGVGLRYFAHGIAHTPVIANAGYAVFVSIASWHFVTGAAKFLRVSREYITEPGQTGAVKRKWRARMINALAATVAAVWVAGGLGVVGRAGKGVGWEASSWDKIYKTVPLLGKMF
ncbi:uncharacterized protein Z518_08601 [Rhinocladiella mackenziei CBS 650.93]|uniref:Mitochondrial adapter protein MCP1 transmembrane domain-containing protein n=1 Tax=Rhinocladiella mackenziei CBS 650.93 TaxID=1442369 RepID=A0A0D2I9T2_9EURO|nr:uncharacterized protein Z518_08601 [Rhinocladiella mackenziei CBS 650.93]KIX02659.1 hypothetical protein Z518_08601 [Rhinocladiella mackenziei CBS 650.93]